MITKDYRERYRHHLGEVASRNRDYQRHLQGPYGAEELFHRTYSDSDHLRLVRLAYDRWWLGYQKTYHHLDDILLQRIYPRGLPGEEREVTWHARRTPSTIYATAKAILHLCPLLPTTPLPDFQSIDPVHRESIFCYIEDKSFLIERNSVLYKPYHYALAHGTIEPDSWDEPDQPQPEHRCKDVYSFLIAAVCKYQVAVSQGYANFPSIDQLRQLLLDRARKHALVTDLNSPRTAIGSWEGGVPELRIIPNDEDIEALFNAYVDQYAIAPNPSDP